MNWLRNLIVGLSLLGIIGLVLIAGAKQQFDGFVVMKEKLPEKIVKETSISGKVLVSKTMKYHEAYAITIEKETKNKIIGALVKKGGGYYYVNKRTYDSLKTGDYINCYESCWQVRKSNELVGKNKK